MCFSAVRLFVALLTFTLGSLVALPFQTQPQRGLPDSSIETSRTHICTSFKVSKPQLEIPADAAGKMKDCVNSPENNVGCQK